MLFKISCLLSAFVVLSGVSKAEMFTEQLLSKLGTEIDSFRGESPAAWDNKTWNGLSELVSHFSNFVQNITLIGWQRVYDDHGKVTEIQSIQLVIPANPNGRKQLNTVEDIKGDEDDDQSFFSMSAVEILKDAIRLEKEIEIHGSITYEELTKEGELINVVYLDNDNLYAKKNGFAVFNTTQIATAQEVSDFISNLKPGAFGKPSVLKYDVNDELIVEQSKAKPHFLGRVVAQEEAPDDIMLASAQIMADIASKHSRKDIPKALSLHYNQVYPKYQWNVVVNPRGHYFILKDFYIVLTYDNFDFDSESDVRYFVYANRKNTN